ncbi:vacuolar sorting protein 39 domain 1-domain-containing protein [Syncephalis plumigaleata]|nr:vacuolar sorting protein 39 domain 1-domain-containing protein [Syncephalis plumigaleata]
MHKAFAIHSLLDNLPLTLSGLAFDDTRIYIATSTGTLIVYEIKPTSKANDDFDVLLLESKKKFSSRPIDQVAIASVDHLIVSLSDGYVNLHDQKTLELKQQLTKSSGAQLFAIHPQDDYNDTESQKDLCIAVVLRKRLLLFTIKEQQLKDTIEYSIPDRVRAMTWINHDYICIGYGRDYVILNVNDGKTTNVFANFTANNHSQSVSYASSAFSVMGAAINAARGVTPMCVRLPGNEVCIVKDNIGVFIDTKGEPTRRGGIHWTTAPETIGFAFPYIITLVNKQLEIRNYKTLTLVQTIATPMMRYLTAGTLVYGASIDQIWRMEATPPMEQVDQLVAAKEYDEAISLLQLMVDRQEPNSERRLIEVKKRYSLHLFSNQHYERAFVLFNEIDIHPREVISLFPHSISGMTTNEQHHEASSDSDETVISTSKVLNETENPTEFNEALSHLIRYLAEKRRWLARAIQSQHENEQLSVGSDYGSPRSPTILTSMTSPPTTLSRKQGKTFPASPPSVSGRSIGSTLAEQPFPEQLPSLVELKQMAEVVDTTLLRAYIATNDGLVGSLLRVKNYCSIEESEQILMKHKKYKELVDLYRGKQLHRLALQLLAQLGRDEDGPMGGCEPTIQYLQRLGIDHIDLIWEFSVWVLQMYPDRGLAIFTEDMFEVDTLPHDQVLDHLEEVSETLAIQYLEYLINDLSSVSSQFHTRLAELYLMQAKDQNEYVTVDSEVATSGNAVDADSNETKSLNHSMTTSHNKLLTFLESSIEYRAERILAQLPNDGFWEERALLLGRLGQHAKALALYARKLHDFKKAEDYCRQQSNSDAFVTLLKIYLQPTEDEDVLLEPALQLLNSPHAMIDAAEAAKLLPNNTDLSLIKDCMQKYIRTGLSSSRMDKVVRSLCDVSLLHAQENLVDAHAKRIIITEDRMCPLCTRRIGTTVFATFPNGTTVHYSCKEKLARLKNHA